MTTPHDTGIQVLCWLSDGKQARHRFDTMQSVWVGLSADDLADAYHGVPTLPNQLNLCVVAIRNPELNRVEFYISYTHLFGLSVAVVNFDRLPELMKAARKRIGGAPNWHFFHDQGTLDFAASD